MSEENDPMTAAQREAICKAYTMLGEHFDHSVIVVNFGIDEDGENVEAHEGFWHGGSMTALGLCHFAADRILHSGRKYNDPKN